MYFTCGKNKFMVQKIAIKKLHLVFLKVQSCKLYNDRYMIASTQITNAEIFAFIAVPVFKL